VGTALPARLSSAEKEVLTVKVLVKAADEALAIRDCKDEYGILPKLTA
jgi:hypothetical protein